MLDVWTLGAGNCSGLNGPVCTQKQKNNFHNRIKLLQWKTQHSFENVTCTPFHAQLHKVNVTHRLSEKQLCSIYIGQQRCAKTVVTATTIYLTINVCTQYSNV